MIQTIGKSQFMEGMIFDKDSSYNNCFTYEAKEALFDYFENLEEDTGEPVEFDPIAICCEWSEYESLAEALDNYGLDSLEELQDNTTVIDLADGGGLLVQNY